MYSISMIITFLYLKCSWQYYLSYPAIVAVPLKLDTPFAMDIIWRFPFWGGGGVASQMASDNKILHRDVFGLTFYRVKHVT